MEDSSSLLGPIVKAWFARNEWPQSVSEGLARSKGWTCGPWASQVSICMSGRLTPKPNFFRGLGQFNAAVAERDFIGVTDRRLMDRLKRGEPLCHDDGTPWTAADFFAAYVGLLEPPADLLTPPKPELTQEMVNQWAEQIRDAFRKLTLVSMSPPGVIWLEIKAIIVEEGVAAEDIDWTQEVLCGLTEATVEMASRIMVKYPEFPLIKTMLFLQVKYGGETTELKKFKDWRALLPQPQNPEELYKGLPKLEPEPKRRIGFDPSAAFGGGFLIPPAYGPA